MAKKKITRRKFIKTMAAGGAVAAGAMTAPGLTRKAFAQKPKQSTRMLKILGPRCGYLARTPSFGGGQ